MRPERDAGTFLRDPVGRYLASTTHVAWCPSPELLGSMHWGRLDDAGAGRLAEVLQLAESARLAPSCSVLVDCRDVDSVDIGSLAMLVRRADARVGAGRHALVVPPGPRGILITGALLQRHCRWRVFHDHDQALASLDRVEAGAAQAEAARAAASMRGTSPMIAQLRRDMADGLAGTSLGACARRLATSVRSLQRELHRHGTSFSRELQRTRLDTALDLLRHTDLKIEAVAARSGLSTASRLSGLVRAHLGLTPTQLRERERAIAAYAVGAREATIA